MNDTAGKTADFTAPEARVLLVDDMPINLAVTEELLKPLQMQIEFASDGREALEKIRQEHFDLVFMDHRMPVMDGVEAVTQLRKQEAYRGLPVVALTGSTDPGELSLFERCGFNGIIRKPVDPDEIRVMTGALLPAGLIRPAATPPGPEDQTELQLNIPGIDPEAAFKNAGSARFLRELLGDVFLIIDEKCNLIESLLSAQDIRAYTTQVHALKTTCGMIGATELSDGFSRLEQEGMNGDPDRIREDTPAVLAELRALKPYLEPYAPADRVPQQEFDRDTILRLLRELSDALRDYELTDAEACMERIASCRFGDDLLPLIRQLEKLISDLDYEEAALQAGTVLAALQAAGDSSV